MTADVINLRRARKAKARTEAEATAAENRVRFGRSKAQKSLAAAVDEVAAKRHEGHRLTPGQAGQDTREPDVET